MIQDKMLRHALKYLGLEINAMIDVGHSEEIATVEHEMEQHNVIGFLKNKYAGEIDLSPFNLGEVYSAEAVEELYASMIGYIEGNERSKFGINHNGLCLLSSLTLEFLGRD